MAKLDVQQSWVKPEFVQPRGEEMAKVSDQLLRHEQGHFIISCGLTQEANLLLRSGGDAREALMRLYERVREMNIKYDRDTEYGKNAVRQAVWEKFLANRFRPVVKVERFAGF